MKLLYFGNWNPSLLLFPSSHLVNYDTISTIGTESASAKVPCPLLITIAVVRSVLMLFHLCLASDPSDLLLETIFSLVSCLLSLSVFLFPVPFDPWASLLPPTCYIYTLLRLFPRKKISIFILPLCDSIHFHSFSHFYSENTPVAGCDLFPKFQTYPDNNTLDLSTWMLCGKFSPNNPQTEVNITL